MIRLGKEIQLLEWGKGTNTTNQHWLPMGTGTLRAQPKSKAGVTLIAVELSGPLNKTNDKDDAIKLAQKSEGMTPGPKDAWGEVAMGRLKSVAQEGGKTVAYIEIKTAIKVGKGEH